MLDRRACLTSVLPFIASSLLASSLLATASTNAAAQGSSYPSKPIQVIVPFAAAGGVDLATRVVADAVSGVLKQSLVIDNRGGGSTIIGSQAAARAQPDGYTLLAAPTTMVMNPALRPKLPFDWEKDFVPVVLAVKLPFVVAAGKDFAAANMKELEQLGKRPGQTLTFGSGGAGTVAHLAGEMFGILTGTPVQHVAYRGEAPALSDAMAGRISVMFSTLASAKSYLDGGMMKPLAVTTKARASLLPSVPTVAEQGYPDYDISAWVAFVAPKGTPPAVVATLNKAVNEALQQPSVRERLTKLGAEPAGGTPEELSSFMKGEAELWAKVIKTAKVTADQ